MWRPSLVLLFSISVTFAEFPNPERQQELLNMLNHDCGACHGLSREGGLGSPLTPEALANKSDDFLISTILEGRKGTAMPPWKKFLKESEARWLVQQLREIKKEEVND
jgi:cytochrome c55X